MHAAGIFKLYGINPSHGARWPAAASRLKFCLFTLPALGRYEISVLATPNPCFITSRVMTMTSGRAPPSLAITSALHPINSLLFDFEISHACNYERPNVSTEIGSLSILFRCPCRGAHLSALMLHRSIPWDFSMKFRIGQRTPAMCFLRPNRNIK